MYPTPFCVEILSRGLWRSEGLRFTRYQALLFPPGFSMPGEAPEHVERSLGSRCSFTKATAPQLGGTFSLIAHRGKLHDMPENTVTSMLAALEAGASMVEIDVHFSRDRVPVVIHDDTLDRTTDGRGPVEARTLGELLAWTREPGLAAVPGERIPALTDVLQSLPTQGRILLDIKVDGLAEPVRQSLHRIAVPQQSIAVAVQTPAQASDFATHTPDAQLLWNFEAPTRWDQSLFDGLRTLGVSGLELGANWSMPSFTMHIETDFPSIRTSSTTRRPCAHC